jgi:hypothetical protein
MVYVVSEEDLFADVVIRTILSRSIHTMSSSGVIREEAAGRQPMGSTSRLEGLPVEVLIEILSHVGFEALDKTRLVSRQLNSIIQLHFRKILPGIIEREFSPAKAFFDALGGHTPTRRAGLHPAPGRLKDGPPPAAGFLPHHQALGDRVSAPAVCQRPQAYSKPAAPRVLPAAC